MDNLTHSLTGALAAKLLETNAAAADDAKSRRALFWLFVVCANLPDLDVLLGLYGDPIFSTKHHRGLTHSVLWAPLFALAPALLCYRFTASHAEAGERFPWLKTIAARLRSLFPPGGRPAHEPTPRAAKAFARFYLAALAGILIHISFDVITSYGTRLLLPFSQTRFALDWMFIVDPFFTIPLGALLGIGKLWPRARKPLVWIAAAFVFGYLGLEMLCSRVAHARAREALARNGVTPQKVSVLPQPLSVFKWKALAQTEAAVYQAFFSLWEESPAAFEKFDNASDPFVARAIATPEVQWYLTFARHPWIRSTPVGDHHLVELTDLQFSVDQALINALGATERQLPFVMRFVFTPQGDLLRQDFNGSSLTSKAAPQ